MEWMALQDKKATDHESRALLQALEDEMKRMWLMGCLPVRSWTQALKLEDKNRTRVVNFTVSGTVSLSGSSKSPVND